MPRPSWDSYFLGIALSVSTRADCRRRKVGAVLVGTDNRVLEVGYNGAPAGHRGCLAGGCPRGLLSYEQVAAMADYSDPTSNGYCIALHAEVNALLIAGRAARGATIYITDEPCPNCRKAIMGAGVVRAVWPGFELDTTSPDSVPVPNTDLIPAVAEAVVRSVPDDAPAAEEMCRSTSPDDDVCIKPRGHKSRWHQGYIPGKRSATRRWEGGIRTPARWEVVDDGY